MKIVALTGLKGSGKDTFASGLELPSFVHLATADHLKEKASQVFGVPLFHFHNRGLKDGPLSIRANVSGITLAFPTDPRIVWINWVAIDLDIGVFLPTPRR
eukprot:CAMPEP_0184521990 /NCGR_PEP_ID=MMETSP0198_2-20121128/8024_1 /TAXON_ID=1112570 /ORGANISM="Thraustochytrium sp., Strain LLF1b" /LENGTH=100 /DNA_ID=CAMNT_0026912749 /DNA_START=1 /DNA_END=299 /DNA_ORIENTATION=+